MSVRNHIKLIWLVLTNRMRVEVRRHSPATQAAAQDAATPQSRVNIEHDLEAPQAAQHGGLFGADAVPPDDESDVPMRNGIAGEAVRTRSASH